MKTYDAVVVGLGTMGSLTALELARRGASVVGFDQFDPPHGLGSHGGETRTFRTGYSENLRYVPLAQLASKLWEELSNELGTRLLNRIGLLMMGPRSGKKISGIERCRDIYNLDIATLSASEIRYRYAALRPPDEFVGLFEKEAGWIDVNSTIALTRKRAESLGAELHANEAFVGWDVQGSGVCAKTIRGETQAKSLIITAGAWGPSLLRELGVPLTVRRKTLFWFDPLIPEQFAENAIPIYGFPPSSFYGFPNIRGKGVKVAEHWGGKDIPSPDNMRPPDERDSASLLRTMCEFMPGLAGPPPGDPSRVIRSATCLYTMTPDEDFILDVHPDFSNVVYATGFSGHGFKFAPVVGRAMADLALQGHTEVPIEFLRLGERQEQWRQRQVRN